MIRPPLDLSLYLVTDTALCGEYGVAATVAAAVRGGVSAVQLRDPHASDDDLVALGRSVAEALTGTGVPLRRLRQAAAGDHGADRGGRGRRRHAGAAPGGLDQLRLLVVASPWPCVAIGGIGAEQARLVRAEGAAGVAVVSAICGRPDPEAAARDIRAAWNRAMTNRPENAATVRP